MAEVHEIVCEGTQQTRYNNVVFRITKINEGIYKYERKKVNLLHSKTTEDFFYFKAASNNTKDLMHGMIDADIVPIDRIHMHTVNSIRP